MERSILRLPFLVSIVVCVALLCFALWGNRSQEGLLQVSFLDVGQGDATFIESPSGTQVLVDGGKGSAVLGQLRHVMGFFDRDIDLIVATHPDMDHIDGLSHVFERYKVGAVLMTENESDTPAYELFKTLVEKEGVPVYYARRGQVYDLGHGDGGSTTLTILFPDRDPTNLESNLSSIVAQLRYGVHEVLLTGDSPDEIEEHLVSLDGATLTSDLLKIGHHGSRTSTSDVFLNIVSPQYAIISAGKDNTYGHPHKEVLDRLNEADAEVLSTIEDGTVTFYGDGEKFEVVR